MTTKPTVNLLCTAPQIRRYLAKISGPLLDRIDIYIEVPRLSTDELMNKRTGENSFQIAQGVEATPWRNPLAGLYGSHNVTTARLKAGQLAQLRLFVRNAGLDESLLSFGDIETGVGSGGIGLVFLRETADLGPGLGTTGGRIQLSHLSLGRSDVTVQALNPD